jgi:hypothetical protein
MFHDQSAELPPRRPRTTHIRCRDMELASDQVHPLSRWPEASIDSNSIVTVQRKGGIIIRDDWAADGKAFGHF